MSDPTYQLAYRQDGSLAFWGVTGSYELPAEETFLDLDPASFALLNANHVGSVVNGELVITALGAPEDGTQ
jgi:hypothetical protein